MDAVSEENPNPDADTPKEERTSLPGRGERAASSRDERMRFRPSPFQTPSEEKTSAPAPKAVLPEFARDTNLGDKRLKPVKVVTVAKPEEPPPSSPSTPVPVEKPSPARLAAGKIDGRKKRPLPPDFREKERVLIAAGLVSHQKLARIGSGGDLVFRCPVCSTQNQCHVADCDHEFACIECGTQLLLPKADSGERIRVVSLPKKKAETGDLPPLELPGERSSEGRSHDARFQAIDDLLPEGEEGTLAWGLEKAELEPEKTTRSGLWLWFAVPLFLLAAALLVWQLFSSAGRSGGSPSDRQEQALVEPSGEIDWNSLSPARRYMLVDQCLRAYLNAPDLKTKAALTRGGPSDEARMAAYYESKGGYEAESRARGPVRNILLDRETIVGGQPLQLAAVRFDGSPQATYALEMTPSGYLVDWEHAEGYGEMNFDALMATPPEKPALLRVHLSETNYFENGFDAKDYRAFNMADPAKERTIIVFARRNSGVEKALARAWNDAVLDSIGDPTNPGNGELDFVLRIRHQNDPQPKGFVIDEVLIRGWILPDKLK